MAYLLRHNPDLLWTARRGNDYGDWLSRRRAARRATCSPPPTGPTTRSSWREMATALGRAERAEHYERLRGGDRRRVQRAPTSATTPTIEGDTQTVYLLALHMDLLPERAARRARPSAWSPNIERHDGHLTTGFVGVGAAAARCSASAGYGDVAHRLLLKDDVPVVGLLDPPRRDHDLGALGRLDRRRAASRRR